MTAAASVAPTGREFLGNNPSLRVAAWLFIAGCCVFAWGWLTAPPNDLGNVLDVGVPIGCVVALEFLVSNVRVVGDRAGYLEVVNFLTVRRVPVEEIVRVDVTSGLRLVLRSGDEVASQAYGRSLVGRLAGYPRSVRAAARLEEFRRSLPPTAWQWSPGQRPVETHLRLRDITVALSLGVGLLLSTAALNLLRAG